MKGGYSGKILRVNLTTKTIGKIDTAKYEAFGGGHGIGSAIFFDLVGDQLPFPAFDPRNLVIMIASPFSGTSVPGSGRCEVQGLGPMLYPVEWFAHSNFGGRFTAQLKYAGWDGIVVEGAAGEPSWINIVDDKVTIESAAGIWGLDTWETQDEISRRVLPKLKYGEWAELEGGGATTQIPAVVCCGPAGENKSRLGALLHGPGSQAALGGFGGVFGSKNLKAISAIGSGVVPIADPKAFMDARLWFNQFLWDPENPRGGDRFTGKFPYTLIGGQPSGGNVTNGSLPLTPARAAACASCPRGCRMRLSTADSNESVCAGTMMISVNGSTKFTRQGNDLMQRYGLGHWQLRPVMNYALMLYKEGVIGKGRQIESDLPFDREGTFGYADAVMRAIALREGVGDDLAEGAARFAEKLGRYHQDVDSGKLKLTYWGLEEHYDTAIEAEWAFGSLLGERDLMLHMIANYPLHWMAMSGDPYLTAEEAAKLYTDAMEPYQGDVYMVDYSDGPTGIYSDSKIKQVAWTKHYEKFWIGGGGFCGWRWPMCITNNTADRRGPTPQAEPKFWNAVTGQGITFSDGMETGHKIYTLDRAIWCLQGRHRDMERFPDYAYEEKTSGHDEPMFIDGKWQYANGAGRVLDREKVEDFKTRFYKFEGCNPENGYPTRATLEGMGMKKVADTLQSKGKLG
ncbi:MAG: aldehyde:ferredoxin oxidoreductase [Acidobacteriota bacterium]|jgi:aldehyde:ferredoxin oxidoreductase|nr:aldehyde:ferredoxin oxidoreductase [Acidobacteriota bacterium]